VQPETSSVLTGQGDGNASKAGLLKLFVPGTPDKVKEKSGTPCKRNL
jgi:hypothetical protein